MRRLGTGAGRAATPGATTVPSGETEIGQDLHNLRTEAEGALGDRFDMRRFHDILLGYGSMPLVVLQEHVRRMIARDAN